jgi:hypothetical protein
MGMLRKAGERLRDFDDKYADAIMNMYAPEDVKGRGLHSIAGMFLGGTKVGKMVPDASEPAPTTRMGRLGEELMGYAPPATSLVARYGAPTAGVAAAYHGIQGLMSTEQTSGTVMPQ